MTTVNPFSQLSGITTAESRQVTERANNDPNEMGVNDFMTLMVAQLENQDPTKPQESTEFLSQLAQFGTVSGVEELNLAMNGLVGSLSSNSGLQAASLVGRDVVSSYNVAPLDDGGTVAGVVELPVSASGMTVEISDLSGNLVHSLPIGPTQAGVIPFEWDGVDANGDSVPPGVYQMTANAIIGGESQAVATFSKVKVESVSMGADGGNVTLNLAGGATMPIANVREFH